MTTLDLKAAKARRDEREARRVLDLRPYTSMDDLPNVTPDGHASVAALVAPAAPAKRGRGRPRLVRTHKACPRCRQSLPLAHYYSNGLCRPCDHQRQRERRARRNTTSTN